MAQSRAGAYSERPLACILAWPGQDAIFLRVVLDPDGTATYGRNRFQVTRRWISQQTVIAATAIPVPVLSSVENCRATGSNTSLRSGLQEAVLGGGLPFRRPLYLGQPVQGHG